MLSDGTGSPVSVSAEFLVEYQKQYKRLKQEAQAKAQIAVDRNPELINRDMDTWPRYVRLNEDGAEIYASATEDMVRAGYPIYTMQSGRMTLTS